MPVVRDFTLEKFRYLCRCLRDCGFTPVTLSGYLRQPAAAGDRCVILRHDVDISARCALRMAGLERDLGIPASYYFRYPSTFQPPTLRAVAAMGHEVGYHYEILTRTGGDGSRAERLFREELSAFRSVCPVSTVAAHGGSHFAQDNRDLWNRCRFQDFELLGEAYLSIPDFLYFSDTGRTWSPRGKVRDAIPGGRAPPAAIHTTDDLVNWFTVTREERLCLNIHPERWPSGMAEEALAIGADFLNNLAKGTIRSVRALRGSHASPDETVH